MRQGKILSIASKRSGFTIVELLVVIVVIGILASITIVSYTGITSKAKIATLQSDLSNASRQLKIYQITNGTYPTSVTDCPTPAAANVCLKASGGASYTPYTSTANTFTLVETASDGTTKWQISDNSGPSVFVVALSTPTLTIPTQCPVDLTWNTVANATSYTVQYATDNAFTTDIHLIQSITSITYVIPANNTLYYYRVQAVNGASTSSWSNVISATSTNICQG